MAVSSIALKRLPFVGLLYGLGSASYDVSKGQYKSAFINLSSGMAAMIPGIGTAASIGIDIAHTILDFQSHKILEELKQYKNYIDSWYNYLINNWKLNNNFAWKAAQLIIYCSLSGLNPIVTSGYRSKEYQTLLRERWDRGDRSGLMYRPALNSDHSKTDILGRPSSTALDMQTNNPGKAASIAHKLNISTGYEYGDSVHFNA